MGKNPYFTVDLPEQGDTFTIYQLKGGPETRDYRFEAYESLQEAGLAVDRQNYDLVYTAPLDGKTTLEDIYRTFNLDRPADFTGHSLSVSDVVVLTRSGKEEAHYCDSFGFTPVPEFFLQREKQLTPRELLTGESIQTPRGSFLVTDMSREQLEAAGYGFHHQSEDGKYLIMGNGTDAFAIPAQQESPIKTAEMTTEQNYNMIDGVLNNTPTMSELEAKAKAGEQISLFDVAEAAKAEARKPKQPQRPAQKQKKPSSGRSSKPSRRNSRRNRRSGRKHRNWRCDAMNRFENVDVLAALEQLMRQNTAFIATILRSTRRSSGGPLPATRPRTGRFCGCPARPGRTLSGKVMCTCKAPRSTTHGSFTGSRPVTGCWPTPWS